MRQARRLPIQAAAAFAGLVFVLACRGPALSPPEAARTSPAPSAPEPAGVERVANLAAAGVVRLVVTRSGPVDGTEEGSAVALAGGLVVTNAHVVRGATRLEVVTPGGHAVPATVLGVDEPTDLAVLRLASPAPDMVPLSFADAVPRVGESVLVVGNAFGSGITVSAGIVAATERSGLGHAQYEDFVVTDARIARGSSGGALVRALTGEVVGIAAGVWVDGPAGAAFGLAISMPLARSVTERLAKGEPVLRGDVGLDASDVASGALITQVDAGSPAERGGLRRDDVVVRAGTRAITGKARLRFALSLVPDGQTIELGVLRGGAPLTLTLSLGSRASLGDEKTGAAEPRDQRR